MANNQLTPAFAWTPGAYVSADLVSECVALFSEHYGRYSAASPIRPGELVGFSSLKLRGLITPTGCGLLTAKIGGRVVAYATVARLRVADGAGFASWVSQLVTHREYRVQRIAIRLLQTAWGFSNDVAWGLITSNPFAIRALESATRRRCDPVRIEASADWLLEAAADAVPYVLGRPFLAERCAINTGFFVDHSRVADKIAKVVSPDKPWLLKDLQEGEEWFGFTFLEQPPRQRTAAELGELLGDADGVLRQAYSRMRPSGEQPWATHAAAEVEFIVSELSLAPASSVLDLGCGRGRHAVELAARSVKVTGVDFVAESIQVAEEAARERGVKVTFLARDGRDLHLAEQFDAVVCLYDVIGSFTDNADNEALVATVARHTRPGGSVVVSVMNYELTADLAIHKGRFADNPDILDRIPPSNIMQATGSVFDPKHFFLDTDDRIVYRKEQFVGDGLPPWEVVVRDRRYSADELTELFRSVGVEPVEVRCVQAGRWGTALQPTDRRAKEVLFVGRKMA